MAVQWITPADKTPVSTGSFVDIDASNIVPVGATGVMVHSWSTDTFSAHRMGIRANGSTDNRSRSLYGHRWQVCAIDENRKFEGYVDNSSICKIYVVGYFTPGVTCITNAVSKAITCDNVWRDIDISGDTTGTAVAAFFEIDTGGDNTYPFGIRCNGSSDDRNEGHFYKAYAMVGVDGNELCEAKFSVAGTVPYLTAYATSGITANVNATNISVGSSGSYIDLAALPAGAGGAFIECYVVGGYNFALRTNGSLEDVYFLHRHCWGFVRAAGGIVEGEVQHLDTDFFLTGYSDSVEIFLGVNKGIVIPQGAAGQLDLVHAYYPKGVFLHDGLIWMYYTAYPASVPGMMALALSRDGINFTKKGAVMWPSQSGDNFIDSGNYADNGPVVFKDGFFWMYYQGYFNVGGVTTWRVCVAISRDGINFVRKGMVLTNGSAGQADVTTAAYTTVSVIDGLFHLYYCAYDGANYRLALAVSKDGINFVKKGVVVPLGANLDADDTRIVHVMNVCHDGSLYWILYGAYDGVTNRAGLASSRDGINWLKKGVSIPLGAAGGPWDAHVVGGNALWHDGRYWIYFNAHDGTSVRIGLIIAKTPFGDLW